MPPENINDKLNIMVKTIYTTTIIVLMLITRALGQYTGEVVYDFTDETIITNQQSADGKLTLGGAYSYHSASYGLNLKVDQTISIQVDGSSTFRFIGSQYSGLNMQAVIASGIDLGEHETKVVNDLTETYEFVYSGTSTTITFTTVAGSGNDTYLPSIAVIPFQEGGTATSVDLNIGYFFDLRDGSIVPTDAPGNVAIEQGNFKIEAGCCNAFKYHDSQHGIQFKDGNVISLQVAGNSYIRLGGDQFSGGTITATSETGSFDITSQSNTTGSTYSDGTPVWVDFLYVGDAGSVVLTHSGSTSYLPFIQVSPTPFDVTLREFVQKSGAITINGTQIDFMSGADTNSNATVTVSAGTVISATSTEASILIDLGGNELSSFTPAVSGDIAAAEVVEDELVLSFTDTSTDPTSYKIQVADNSQQAVAEPGSTYTYNFFDGSEMPQVSYNELRYPTFVTGDGIVTINSNTDDESLQFGYHDSSHGGVFFSGNSFDIVVAGNAIVTFIVDFYGSAEGAVFEFTDAAGNALGSIAAENIGVSDGFPSNFGYTGPAGTITATLVSHDFPTAEIYLHGMSIANEAAVQSNGKIDVWDFGAAQLGEEDYNNNLTESIINEWYDSEITVGSSGNVMPSSFEAGRLSWTGGSNDRLRTSNANLTRYDENLSGVDEYTGRIYVNSTGAAGRYMSLTLTEDDEVTLMMLCQNAGGLIHFENVSDPSVQLDQAPVNTSNEITEVKFVAKAAGTYRVYDTQDKPSYYRILRKDADYAAITGNVDVSGAPGIPEGYQIVFTNVAGKAWAVDVVDGAYSVELPAGYSYELSLADANGYVISSETTLAVEESATSFDVDIIQVELFTVSGSIVGLADAISNLELVYTSDPSAEKIFKPRAIVDVENSTYSVELEPNVEYTITAHGVNDFEIPANTITITAAQSADVTFAAKATHAVTITSDGLSTEQLAAMELTFVNLHEEGYSYSFESIEGVALRDGTYVVITSGLDDYAVEQALTSNLTISGAAATKAINFNAVHNWEFDDQDIPSGKTSYKGMFFTGSISNEVAKGHLVGGAGGTIQVPVNVGEKVIITYYYTADFAVEGGEAVTTSSNSTSLLESVDYVYTGTEAGYVNIAVNATTYFTKIETTEVVAFAEVVTVGSDKDFQTINDALSAVKKMDRPNSERVTISIDPGNYEEMLVINIPNVTLKNASNNPTIGLANKGVDITDGAVRITSYYGHGYNYYSMGSDQKWHADILQVNKENGYLSRENRGSGTTDGSYWNATVVVFSEGFRADDIIFENSFNQYISQKESEDVVVEWVSGGKGTRPTNTGNTSVQDRSYVERAAALAIGNNVDKVVLRNCRVVGRQDSFFGGVGSRVAIYRGAYMGAVDYIFGGMTAVFYKSDLVMNTSDVSSDAAYLTAAQQQGDERGFLMYECAVTSAVPDTESASATGSKPGYFGRPWQATTSEVVFYNTTIEASEFPGSEGKSLISPEGWRNTLGGESAKMYEYGTMEASGEDNSASRASWATLLNAPTLSDGTEISPFNFTKGSDDWDPIPGLLDTNTALANLEVAEGDLVPAFDPTVTSYSVVLPFGTTAVTVTADAASEYADLAIGEFAVLPGSDKITVTAEDGSMQEYTIAMTIEDPLGINTGINGLALYPNPASDRLQVALHVIATESLTISLFNLQGALVSNKVESRLAPGHQQISFDLSEVHAGMYLVKVMLGNTTETRKILIKK